MPHVTPNEGVLSNPPKNIADFRLFFCPNQMNFRKISMRELGGHFRYKTKKRILRQHFVQNSWRGWFGTYPDFYFLVENFKPIDFQSDLIIGICVCRMHFLSWKLWHRKYKGWIFPPNAFLQCVSLFQLDGLLFHTLCKSMLSFVLVFHLDASLQEPCFRSSPSWISPFHPIRPGCQWLTVWESPLSQIQHLMPNGFQGMGLILCKFLWLHPQVVEQDRCSFAR